MSKHTPAPWVARIDEIGVDVFQSKSGFGITQIGNYDELRKANYPIEIAEANAKLIAAAPELLEALRSARALLSVQGITEESRIGGIQMKDINEAIKKATE